MRKSLTSLFKKEGYDITPEEFAMLSICGKKMAYSNLLLTITIKTLKEIYVNLNIQSRI